MNKLVSYSLFISSIKPNVRSHDKDQNKGHERYWYNIPFLIYFWLDFYKNYDIIIYINSEIKRNPLYPLLVESQLNYKNFKIKQMPKIIGAQGAIYRFQPIFGGFGNYDVIYSRDIDSVPKVSQMSAMAYFQSNEYNLMNIRSLDSHNSPLTKIMAGLCGFKTQKLKQIINNYNFKNYMINHKYNWGYDQDLLIKYFTRPQLLKYFLQIRTNDSVIPIQGFNVKSLDIKQIPQIQIDQEMKEMLGKTNWAGEPSDFRNELHKIPKESKIYKIIQKNQILRNFYLKSEN